MQQLLLPPTSYVILAFISVFIGYAVGRRRGKREGFRAGVHYAPLEMRRQTWEKGHCVICGRSASEPKGAEARNAGSPSRSEAGGGEQERSGAQ